MATSHAQVAKKLGLEIKRLQKIADESSDIDAQDAQGRIKAINDYLDADGPGSFREDQKKSVQTSLVKRIQNIKSPEEHAAIEKEYNLDEGIVRGALGHRAMGGDLEQYGFFGQMVDDISHIFSRNPRNQTENASPNMNGVEYNTWNEANASANTPYNSGMQGQPGMQPGMQGNGQGWQAGQYQPPPGYKVMHDAYYDDGGDIPDSEEDPRSEGMLGFFGGGLQRETEDPRYEGMLGALGGGYGSPTGSSGIEEMLEAISLLRNFSKYTKEGGEGEAGEELPQQGYGYPQQGGNQGFFAGDKAYNAWQGGRNLASNIHPIAKMFHGIGKAGEKAGMPELFDPIGARLKFLQKDPQTGKRDTKGLLSSVLFGPLGSFFHNRKKNQNQNQGPVSPPMGGGYGQLYGGDPYGIGSNYGQYAPPAPPGATPPYVPWAKGGDLPQHGLNFSGLGEAFKGFGQKAGDWMGSEQGKDIMGGVMKAGELYGATRPMATNQGLIDGPSAYTAPFYNPMDPHTLETTRGAIQQQKDAENTVKGMNTYFSPKEQLLKVQEAYNRGLQNMDISGAGRALAQVNLTANKMRMDHDTIGIARDKTQAAHLEQQGMLAKLQAAGANTYLSAAQIQNLLGVNRQESEKWAMIWNQQVDAKRDELKAGNAENWSDFAEGQYNDIMKEGGIKGLFGGRGGSSPVFNDMDMPNDLPDYRPERSPDYEGGGNYPVYG